MNMWVRSQDKDRLLKVEDFRIVEQNEIVNEEEFVVEFDDDEELSNKIEKLNEPINIEITNFISCKDSNKIRIEYIKKNMKYYCHIVDFNYVILGEYSTKEKALKVLDEIEKFITLKSYNDNLTEVYQMPQDSEVKDYE